MIETEAPAHLPALRSPVPALLPDTVHVVACPHPFRMEREICDVPAGLTIEDMIERFQPDPVLSRFGVAFINEVYIPRHLWRVVRPKPGTRVVIRAVPTGGGGGNKSPLRTILTIAVIAASFVAPELLLGNAAGNVLFAGVTQGQVLGAAIAAVGSVYAGATPPAVSRR